MQSQHKPSRGHPARGAGQDLWAPWIELVLGIGTALWGGDRRFHVAGNGDGKTPSGNAGPLMLVHSCTTVALPAKKRRPRSLRLVVRLRADG